jgi:hypothetical protein
LSERLGDDDPAGGIEGDFHGLEAAIKMALSQPVPAPGADGF